MEQALVTAGSGAPDLSNHPLELVTAIPTPNAVHCRAAICAPSIWGEKYDVTRIAETTMMHSTAACRRACSPAARDAGSP